jgi:predicted transporter
MLSISRQIFFAQERWQTSTLTYLAFDQLIGAAAVADREWSRQMMLCWTRKKSRLSNSIKCPVCLGGVHIVEILIW